MIAEVDNIIQDPSQSESELYELEEDSQPKIELTESPLATYEDDSKDVKSQSFIQPEVIDVTKNLRSQLSEVKEA